MLSYTGTSKMRRFPAILCASVAVLSMTACAVDQTRMAALSAPPYLALTTEAAAGMARQSGYFTQNNGCVVFRPTSGAADLTPVFQSGQTMLATDGTEWLGLYLQDTPVAMDKVYRIKGAALAYGAQPRLATPVPGGCPSRYFVVGSVGSALADDNVNRFCAGVTLCRSYSFN
jgi:hypothetical protein